MAKKSRALRGEEIEVKEKVKPSDIFTIAKFKGYEGVNSLSLIQDWVRLKHRLYTEIFFSLFHKKWSLNNYILDLSNLKKIDRPTKVVFYDEYDDALCQALDEMLQLI